MSTLTPPQPTPRSLRPSISEPLSGEERDPIDLDVCQKCEDGYLRRIRRRTVGEVIEHVRAVYGATAAGQNQYWDRVFLPLAAPFPPALSLVISADPGANEGNLITLRAIDHGPAGMPGMERSFSVWTSKTFASLEKARAAANALRDAFWDYGNLEAARTLWQWWHKTGALLSPHAATLRRYRHRAAIERARAVRVGGAWFYDLPHADQRTVEAAAFALGWPAARQALDLPDRFDAPAGLSDAAGALYPTRSFV